MKPSRIIIIVFLLCGIIFPQGIDSTKINGVDSLLNNKDFSKLKDTTQNHRFDVDSVIYASSSDSLIFYIKNRKMDIYGDSKLKYKNTDLNSANMFINFKSSEINAEGVPSDSVPNQFKDTPVLNEGGETYSGKTMKYNFKTSRGFISSAGTESEGAYYNGEKINKVDKNTYFVEDGTYTTCDANPPHYYFFATEMKVIQKDQIDAKWVFLYFGGVPLPLPIPFAVFPLQSGRRSGLIAPAYGDDANYGKYFSHLGYFWAISDFMDLNLTTDYYTRGSYRLNSRFRYAERYNFTGSLSGSYAYLQSGEKTDFGRTENTSWRLQWNHNQNLTPTMRFDAKLDFMSGNFVRRNIVDLNQQLTNTITSNATFFKSWEESGNSLSLSYSRTQELESGNINEVLPNLTFSKNQTYPFRDENSVGTKKWYELFGYNYSGQFENTRNKTNGQLKIRGGIQHSLNFSMSPKVGYFSIVPNLRYQERWYNKSIEQYSIVSPNTGNDSVITKDVKDLNFVRTFSTGVSASTKFYGIFQPNIFGISAFRHTVNPSVSYTFTPDFSKPFWGYFGSYTTAEGKIVKYNKFTREVYGGPSSGERQSLSFSLGNIFEMKTQADPTDTTSKVNKIQLLNLNAGISYNFAADSVKFSDLNVSYRTQVGDIINFQGSSNFSLYENNQIGQNINKFLIKQGRGLLRMTNFSFSISTSFSGEKLKSNVKDSGYNTELAQYNENKTFTNDVYTGIYNDKPADFSIPWDIQLSYNYSLNKSTPTNISKYSNLSSVLNFNLTPKWKFSFSGSYDFQRKEFAAPQIKISRDLHAWIMNFTWNPIGTYRGYYLEIRVKAPQLSDLKLTKRDQFYEGR